MRKFRAKAKKILTHLAGPMGGTETIFVRRAPGKDGAKGPRTGICMDAGGLQALHTRDATASQEGHHPPVDRERTELGNPASQDPERGSGRNKPLSSL